MRNPFLFPFILFSFLYSIYGCGTRELVDKGMTNSKMSSLSSYDSILNNMTITVSSSDTLLPVTNSIIKNKSYLIPLPFLAFYKQNYTCKPSKSSYELLSSNIKSIFIQEIAESGVSKLINKNCELQLKISEFQSSFDYHNQGAIVLFYRSNFEFVNHFNVKIRIDYKLINDSTILKEGIILKDTILNDTLYQEDTWPAVPSYVKNPDYNPNSRYPTYNNQQQYKYNTNQDWAQMNGGTLAETTNAMQYLFVSEIKLISDVAKEIINKLH